MVQAGTTVPTRNAEELAQREQARELGSGLVLAFYRLVKTAQLHALDNMAVHQQIEQTLDTIKLFQAKTGARMSILFAKSTVFVAGQLMKGSRGDYESALELGDMLGRFGFSELIVDHDVGTDDLKKLVAAYAAAAREGASKKLLARPSPNIRLRSVSPAVLAEDEAAQSEEEKIVRAYASAIVVMRRVFENLTARRYQLPHEAKRIAQKLVMLSEGDTPAFLGVTAMRNANHDSAGRAVNTSILAVSMARQLSTDLGVLAKVAMAALLYDVGGPYVLDLPERSDDQPLIIPRMMEDDAARLPAASALILTAMGQLHEASQIRSVIAYEAHWQRNQRILGTLYGGARNASVASRIVKTAHRFNELLTPDPGASKFATPDEAVTTLNAEAEDDVDRAIVALLVGAIGMFPTGSLVELTTGERGVVVSTPSHPADYARPIVRLVTSPAGTPMTPVDIDCVEDEQREVKQVLREADERLLQARQQVLAERGGEAAPQRRPRAKKQYGPGLETTAPPPKKWADSSPPGAPSPNDVATVPPKARPSHPAHGQRKPSRATPLIPREEVTDDELPVPTLPPEEKAAKSSTPSAPQSSPPDAAESAPPSSTPGAATSRPPRPLESQPPTVRRPTDAEASAPSDAPGSAPPGALTRPPPPDYEAIASRSQRPDAIPKAPATPNIGSDTLAPPGGEPTASGALTKTPLAHLLVYVLDKELTGTVVLTDPKGVEHGIYLDRGTPRRAWSKERIAPLGPLLIAMGFVTEADFKDGGSLAPVKDDEALLEGELLGSGTLDSDDFEGALDEQVQQRVAHLFTLPPETRYDFFADQNLLLGKACDSDSTLPALALLMAGVREIARSAAIDNVLLRAEGHLLNVHADADLGSFEFTPEEASILEEIISSNPPMSALLSSHDEHAVRGLIYALMITRSLDFGASPQPPVQSVRRPET